VLGFVPVVRVEEGHGVEAFCDSQLRADASRCVAIVGVSLVQPNVANLGVIEPLLRMPV
jgi:hypothetical protein